jgi:hypothetical protein
VSAPAAADPEAEYYQAVEEFFVSIRGDPLFLSNADWNLVRQWRRAGLPLRVVLRGIKDALDAHAHGWSRGRKVGSLAYCTGEVDAARERWERALSLGRDEGPGAAEALAGFAQQLEAAAGGLPAAAAPLARTVAAELREADPGASLETLTALLAEREARLVAALTAGETQAGRDAREAGVDAALAPWRGRMPARVLDQLRADSLARRLLEGHGLPRLSLFHLEGGGGEA